MTKKILTRLLPAHRFIISSVVTLIVFIGIVLFEINPKVEFMILWNVFSLTYIITSWTIFLTRSANHIRCYAKVTDNSRVIIFVTVICTGLISMFNVGSLLISKVTGQIAAAIIGVALSWALIHTVFALHYAHMYYGNYKDEIRKGLVFPGEEKPDYLDFAYFSFVIGMTFQVSDVQITNKLLRRTVFLHSVISFILFTFVVALAINIIGGIGK